MPPRWLVIRRIRGSVPDFKTVDIPAYKPWVLESDHQQMVDDVGDGQDLRIDASPFISAPSGNTVDIKKQAEVFVGKKIPVRSWTEPKKPGEKENNAPLTILNGGNILFRDFQQHNDNVFSVLDDSMYI